MLLVKAIPLNIFNKTPKHLSFKNVTFHLSLLSAKLFKKIRF